MDAFACTFQDPANFISSRLDMSQSHWAQHAKEINKDGVWKDEEVITEKELAEVNSRSIDIMKLDMDVDVESTLTSTEQAFEETVIDAGQRVIVALGDESDLKGVFIKYIGSGDEDDAIGIQNTLCDVLEVCDTDGTGKVDEDKLQTDPDTDELFLEFVFPESAMAQFNSEDVDFSVEIHTIDGNVMIRRYAVEMAKRRQKRYKEYKSWSSFPYYSIPDESYFPDHYRQHTHGKCAVGCGPVAWAMIFGYLDRRSHFKSSTYGTGSQGLYRSGSDGTSGSNSQVAPDWSDTRMRRYKEKLHDILNTFCISSSGATTFAGMDNIESFFKARQKSGNPRVVSDKWLLSYLGVYKESIAGWTRNRIKEGWPVIVTTKKTWISGWHYPVATRYRGRSRKYSNCVKIIIKICGAWKTQVDNDMYLHQGWGGNSDGWYAMKSFFSIAAKY